LFCEYWTVHAAVGRKLIVT